VQAHGLGDHNCQRVNLLSETIPYLMEMAIDAGTAGETLVVGDRWKRI
jgi:hypothetical protein